MKMLIALAGLTISVGMLLRIVLMLSGQLKGPVLAYFQKYGDLEQRFYPLKEFVFWLAWFVLFSTTTLAQFVDMTFPAEFITILLLISAYWIHVMQDTVQRWIQSWPTLPIWYRRLQDGTTRHERRRLAYMWLRLPLRTRLLYNANTHAFEIWAEMVILATL